ncbi:MAG: hypothetical protein IJ593_04685 [Lachnospiraceae bacterium]|nr:hypothetical protein [Lachnospiraceae bacterium]
MKFSFMKVSKDDIYPYICDFLNRCHGTYEIYDISKSNMDREFFICGRGTCGDYPDAYFEYYLRFIKHKDNLYIYVLPKYKYDILAIYCVGNPNTLMIPIQVPDLAEKIRKMLPDI